MRGKQQTKSMKTQHTPGPWRVCNRGDDLTSYTIEGKAWGRILDVADTSNEPEANARLIAAAPDLAEVLRDAEFLLRQVGNNWKEAASMADSFRRSAADARAVLAKLEVEP